MKSLLTMLLPISIMAANAMPPEALATGLKTAQLIYEQKDGKSSPPQAISSGKVTIDASIVTLKKFSLKYTLKPGHTLLANNTSGTVNADKTITFNLGTELLKTKVKLAEKDATGKITETFNVEFTSISAIQTPSASNIATGLKTAQLIYAQIDGKPSAAQAISSGKVNIDPSLATLKKFTLNYDLKTGHTLIANTTTGSVNTDKTISFDVGTELLKTKVKLSEKDAIGKITDNFDVEFTYGAAAQTTPPAPDVTGLKTAQVIYIQNDGKPSPPQAILSGKVTIDPSVVSLKKFNLKYDLKAGNTLTANTTAGTVNTDNTITFDIGTELLKTSVKLSEKDATRKEIDNFTVQFSIGQATPNMVSVTALTQADYQSFFDRKYKSTFTYTDIGYKEKSNYFNIHIFLDQYGNALFSSLPTGIQRKYHYIIHIIGNPIDGQSRFILNQTTGTLSDSQANYGVATTVPDVSKLLQGADINNSKAPTINETIFEFPPTTDDMTFTVSQLSADGKTNTLLKTYVIKKTSFYVGSFNVGIFKTWLSNPTFTSINSPTETGKQALKSGNTSPYVTATLMYTIYFSLYNALNPKGNDGKVYGYWGRSYLDDEGCFIRKIYPAVGIGLGSNALSNWFFGLNYEPMQGFGIFAGRNVRTVNTFNAPSSVDLNNITTDQFNYYQNTKTKSDWSVGVLLDLSVFTKIIGSVSSNK